MIPGVNPRQMKAMMRQMGMSQVDIDAIKVTIETSDKKIIFNNPEVQKITMQGQTTFQISGQYEEEENKPQINISDDDIELVSSQAKVNKNTAKSALEKSQGDIAQAIIELTKNE
jgi:nascent polypeptide-associated complex subunit alpha